MGQKTARKPPEPVDETPAATAMAPPSVAPVAENQAPPPAQPPAAPDRQASRHDELLATAKLLGFALSARALLFVALLGAFALGMTAMIKGGWMPLLVLVAYGALAVVPVAYLEIRRRAN